MNFLSTWISPCMVVKGLRGIYLPCYLILSGPQCLMPLSGFPTNSLSVVQSLKYIFFSTLAMYHNMASGAPGEDFPMGFDSNNLDNPDQHTQDDWSGNKLKPHSQKGKGRERASELKHHCSSRYHIPCSSSSGELEE